MKKNDLSFVVGKILIASLKTLGVCAGAFIILSLLSSFFGNNQDTDEKAQSKSHNLDLRIRRQQIVNNIKKNI